METDIEIARDANKLNIIDIAQKLNIDDIECFGKYKAKIDYKKYTKEKKVN